MKKNPDVWIYCIATLAVAGACWGLTPFLLPEPVRIGEDGGGRSEPAIASTNRSQCLDALMGMLGPLNRQAVPYQRDENNLYLADAGNPDTVFEIDSEVCEVALKFEGDTPVHRSIISLENISSCPGNYVQVDGKGRILVGECLSREGNQFLVSQLEFSSESK